MDQKDKAGAYSMTGGAGQGNGGQETAALRPKDSAESNEGQLSPRILLKLPQRGGRGRRRRGGITTLEGKLAALPQ